MGWIFQIFCQSLLFVQWIGFYKNWAKSEIQNKRATLTRKQDFCGRRESFHISKASVASQKHSCKQWNSFEVVKLDKYPEKSSYLHSFALINDQSKVFFGSWVTLKFYVKSLSLERFFFHSLVIAFNWLSVLWIQTPFISLNINVWGLWKLRNRGFIKATISHSYRKNSP